MKYAAEMGSGAMVYMPSFIMIDSAIQKLIGGGGYTDSQLGDCISLILFFVFFFQNKENRLVN
jgi:hypothetical protein